MPVSLHTDPERRRVTATVPAGTRWTEFESTVLGAVKRSPELTDWNWVIDDQGPMDDVDVNGMVRIGEAFRAGAAAPDRQTFTVVVSQDRFFDTWARVIDLNYGIRRHHAAPSLAAAVALLDRLEASVGGMATTTTATPRPRQ